MSKRPRPSSVQRATMHDVARAAGVSPSTVSNVVNDRLSVVREETRARVERAVKDLRYRPQATARGLRSSRDWMIGLLVIDDSPTFLADPFITHVVAGLSNHLGSHGYGFLLQGSQANRIEDTVFVRDARTDALCVLSSGSQKERHRIYGRLAELNEPMVLLMDPSWGQADDCCIVRQDDRGGASAIGRHLLECGARHIVFLAPELEWASATQRVRGLREAVRRHDKNSEIALVHAKGANFAGAQAGLAEYLSANEMPDAVVAANDQFGIAAMRLLEDRGVDVPEEVMITGFNGFEFWQYTRPVLTTVRSAAYDIGVKSAEVLIERLSLGRFSKSEIVLPVTLQEGGSTRLVRR